MTQKQLLQGAGDGTAVPAGYIGETLITTSAVDSTQSLPSQGTGYDLGPSLVITAGKWLITSCAEVRAVRATGTGATALTLSTRDGSNNTLCNGNISINSGFADNFATITSSFVLTTAGITLKQTMTLNQIGAVNTYTSLVNKGTSTPAYISAVRIG